MASAKSWPSESILVQGSARARGTGDTGVTVLGVTVACPGEHRMRMERAEAANGELNLGGKW